MNRLQGKAAIVTGGSRGIGEAIARAFAREGADVLICSRKREGVDAAVARLARAGRSRGGDGVPRGEDGRPGADG